MVVGPKMDNFRRTPFLMTNAKAKLLSHCLTHQTDDYCNIYTDWSVYVCVRLHLLTKIINITHPIFIISY